MQEIGLTILRFFQYLIVGIFVGSIVLILVIASLNERLRRITLVVMSIAAGLSVLAALIFIPRGMHTAQDWSETFASFKTGFIESIPILLILLFFGLVYAVVGQYFVEILQHKLHGIIRRRYLKALLAALGPQLNEYVTLDERAGLMAKNPEWVRVTGQAGSGKSLLLKQALARLARQALQREDQLLPVLIDLDQLPDFDQLEDRPRNLSAIQPVRLPLLNWMLKRQARKRGILFFIDSSEQTFSPSFVMPDERNAILRALDGMIDYFAPCPVALALPEFIRGEISDSAASLERGIPSKQSLGPLQDSEVLSLLTAWLQKETSEKPRTGSGRLADKKPILASDRARVLTTTLLSGGVWEQLARSPLILRHLARAYNQTGKVPENLRALFRASLYPPALPPGLVEGALVHLAQQMQKSRHYALPTRLLNKGEDAPLPRKGLLEEMEEAGLLQEVDKQVGTQVSVPCVEFAHPLYLAYFIALSWLDPKTKLGQIFARDKNGSSFSSPAPFRDDPILAEALVFFNNIESDPDSLRALLNQLAQSDDYFSQFLVTQCLLAMPAAARPPELVKTSAVQLIQAFACDESAVRPAHDLLAGLDPLARLGIYEQALSGMDDTLIEQTLRRIAGDDLTEIRSILWHADPKLASRVGLVWNDIDPTGAFYVFSELYEQGPVDRRDLALELLGSQPKEAVETYLYERLKRESDPQTRINLLRALTQCGAEVLFTLLDRVSDPHEAEPVRVFAAQALAASNSPALRAENVVREIVRVGLMPLPDPARFAIARLLDQLRKTLPGGVERWESVVNPYIIGRPIQDPRMLFGRGLLLQSLRASIESGNHVLLSGERRIGKSSILYGLARNLDEEASQGVPVRVVIVDLQGLAPNEFYETLIRSIIEQVREPGLVADSEIPRPYTDQAFERDLSELVQYLVQQHGPLTRLALLLDEADAIIGFPASMQAAIRRILTSPATRALVGVFSTSQPQRWSRAESPFYNLFTACPVPRLEPGDAQALILKPVSQTFSYEPDALAMIQTAAEGKPYEIQALCQTIINDLLARGERVITIQHVTAALNREHGGRADLLTQSEGLLCELMDWLEANPNAPDGMVEQQLKKTWNGLREAMIQQVIQMRKKV